MDKDLENKFIQMVSKVEQKQDKTAYAIWPEFQLTHANKNIANNIEINNPSFISKTVDFYKIDEIGSNFEKDVFDPYNVAKSENDYYKGIADRQIEQFPSKNLMQDGLNSGIIPSSANAIGK